MDIVTDSLFGRARLCITWSAYESLTTVISYAQQNERVRCGT